MASVRFESAQRLHPGQPRAAVAHLDLAVADGEFMVLVGPSGCGKSTTLRMLAGLEEVTSGAVYIGDQDVTHLAPQDRDVAMVLQNYALYPHLSVAENLGFALKIAGVEKQERATRVTHVAELLGLQDFLERRPQALSGGQRQRVAMGRAIVREPQVFCMDEPLSNLDATLRVSTRTQIAELQRRLGITTIYVTHDQVEAMTMGDRVAVLDQGELQQVGAPLTLYDRPANLFVAGFIGSPAMNLMTATAIDGHAKVGDHLLPIERAAATQATGPITIGVRPEHWRVDPSGDGLPMRVTVVEELGSDAFAHGTCDVAGTPSTVTIRAESGGAINPGQLIAVRADPRHVHVFDTESGARLSSEAAPTHRVS